MYVWVYAVDIRSTFMLRFVYFKKEKKGEEKRRDMMNKTGNQHQTKEEIRKTRTHTERSGCVREREREREREIARRQFNGTVGAVYCDFDFDFEGE